jgi:hypothetical protein
MLTYFSFLATLFIVWQKNSAAGSDIYATYTQDWSGRWSPIGTLLSFSKCPLSSHFHSPSLFFPLCLSLPFLFIFLDILL